MKGASLQLVPFACLGVGAGPRNLIFHQLVQRFEAAAIGPSSGDLN